MLGLIKRIRLTLNPPRKGDIFFGDSADFLCERNSERFFYPMKDLRGHEIWRFFPGPQSYKFRISSAAMPYYICETEILVFSKFNFKEKRWLRRSIERRIWKKDFNRLIAEGRLKRSR